MPYNLLLVPLLGGYIFVRYWNFTKIHMLRADKDRMIIRASIAGLTFLVLAFASSNLIQLQLLPCSGEDGFCLYSWWSRNVPFEYTGVSLLAFVFAIAAIWPANKICPWEKAVIDAIVDDGEPFEIALFRSREELLSLAITLDNGKVYVGVVTHGINPSTPTENISILPLQSGYRDPLTKQLFLPVNYAIIIERMTKRLDQLSFELSDWNETASVQAKKKPKSANEAKRAATAIHEEWESLRNRIDLFEVFIPVSRIASAFFYDDITYQEYFQKNDEESAEPSK